MADRYWLYIMANRPHGTLYVGSTSDLVARVTANREGRGAAFVRRYGLNRLVHYEECGSYDDARLRETRIKKWRRAWKVELVESANPAWDDLYETLV
jgi:putative endonuclease